MRLGGWVTKTEVGVLMLIWVQLQILCDVLYRWTITYWNTSPFYSECFCFQSIERLREIHSVFQESSAEPSRPPPGTGTWQVPERLIVFNAKCLTLHKWEQKASPGSLSPQQGPLPGPQDLSPHPEWQMSPDPWSLPHLERFSFLCDCSLPGLHCFHSSWMPLKIEFPLVIFWLFLKLMPWKHRPFWIPLPPIFNVKRIPDHIPSQEDNHFAFIVTDL